MVGLLAEKFAEERTNVVEWMGAPAYASYQMETVPDSLSVTFEVAVAIPVQGLQVRVQGAQLVVNGQRLSELVLWRDTAPDTIHIGVAKKSRKASLWIWNVWRGGMGVTQAWIGNAGMRVEKGSDTIRLKCSDGHGPAEFNDLIISIVTESTL